jgi:hypothetical protein
VQGKALPLSRFALSGQARRPRQGGQRAAAGPDHRRNEASRGAARYCENQGAWVRPRRSDCLCTRDAVGLDHLTAPGLDAS